jgi:mRNA-degrading endonuclease toxin of MazEF toxin-antitoxin module
MTTPSTTRFSQGEVVLTPFPITSPKSTKRRPAVVISSNWFNANRDDRLLLGVTSHIPDELERDEVLIPDEHLSDAGLPRRSLVKVAKIASVNAAVIDRGLGRLPDKTLHAVLERLSEVLGLL